MKRKMESFVLVVAFRKAGLIWKEFKMRGELLQRPVEAVYLLLVYLVTALVPSEMACLESSPGR